MADDDKYVVKGFPPLGPIPNVSLGRLIYNKLSTEIKDTDALVDAITGEAISYKKLLEQTCLLAKALENHGYGRNTMMSICSSNCKEFYIPVIAAMYIGAIIAPVNPNLSRLEMIHVLNISKPTLVFCSQQTASRFFEIKKDLKFIKKILIIDNNFGNSVNEFINVSSTKSTNFTPIALEPDHIGFILCSSGTTGLPKGVMVTHRNVVTALMQIHDLRLFNQRKDLCLLGSLPFFHTLGLFRTMSYLFKGIKIVVLKNFENNLFLKTIEIHKITTLFLVPPLAFFMATSPLVDKYKLSSLVEIICSGAPMSKDTEKLLKNRLNVEHIQQVYGLTESTLRLLGHVGFQKYGSCGKVVPYMMCKIRDLETGRSLGPNQIGELCFKGPMITKGYYNNEEATKNNYLSDGWLLTGDVGYYDEDNYFYIVDRVKEMIKYKGNQVAPAEVEALLLTHPNIEDAAVVGISDENAGELPLAFVVSNSSGLTAEAVKEFVSERMSSPKKLRGGVVFISKIPKNASGKILRRELKQLLTKYKPKL